MKPSQPLWYFFLALLEIDEGILPRVTLYIKDETNLYQE